MAATLYGVPKYLILLLFLGDIYDDDSNCLLSKNVKFVLRDLQHLNLWHFEYLTLIVQQAVLSTKKLPRWPISAWHKHGHICLLVRKKDITVDMDIE